MTLSPDDIRTLRGHRSRAELAALVGVTPLTVYRWELPVDAPESRRPRGQVLRRVLELVAAAPPASAPSVEEVRPPTPFVLDNEDHASLAPVLHAIDECRLDEAEHELVRLLTTGALTSEAARALATIALAKLHLLARHDATSAMTTLLGVMQDEERLPPRVRLELHLTSALLFAHADGRLFNPGKTHHHVMLAERLLAVATEDQRFFLGYVQLSAAAALFDAAVLARAREAFLRVREHATSRLARCLALEAEALTSLSLQPLTESALRTDALRSAAEEAGLPLQRMRGLAWSAQNLLDQGGPPSEALALLEEAERVARTHRIAGGIHEMLMSRNKGDALLRLGRLADAEQAFHDAAKAGEALAYTPLRIFTSLSRLYLLSGRAEETSALASRCSSSDDVQRDLTRALGEVLRLLTDVAARRAPVDWLDAFTGHMKALQRLGAWVAAYRDLACYALTVASTYASVEDGERVLQIAAQALEAAPSPPASAVHRTRKAVLLLRRGAITEARRLLAAARATFEASGDLPEAALARWLDASAAVVAREANAEAEQTQREHELRALGLAIPPPLVVVEERTPPPARAPLAALRLEDLLVPLERLRTRGAGASMLQDELIDIARELYPGRAVRLVEVDSSGNEQEIGRRVEHDTSSFESFELRDGVGRLLRLDVAGPLTEDQRVAAQLVALTAGLAFEVAGLRGLSSPVAQQSRQRETDETALPDFIAASPTTRRLRAELGRLSGSRAIIIVTGESGTGKEVVARAIHDLSRRSSGPYVTFNSAAVPRELFEGQLFGYKKGAFTGATTDHPGVIRAAEGGTLFLDEIGELPLDVQPKLLRFLENGEVLPLGERRPVQVDVRVIAATHRDLLGLVREGRFREDLYYRLQVVPVHLPPLRERREDVVALTRFFLRKLTPAGREPPLLLPDGEAKLVAHPWPGNVRELRNVVERSLAFDPLPRLLGAEQIVL